MQTQHSPIAHSLGRRDRKVCAVRAMPQWQKEGHLTTPAGLGRVPEEGGLSLKDCKIKLKKENQDCKKKVVSLKQHRAAPKGFASLHTHGGEISKNTNRPQEKGRLKNICPLPQSWHRGFVLVCAPSPVVGDGLGERFALSKLTLLECSKIPTLRNQHRDLRLIISLLCLAQTKAKSFQRERPSIQGTQSFSQIKPQLK